MMPFEIFNSLPENWPNALPFAETDAVTVELEVFLASLPKANTANAASCVFRYEADWIAWESCRPSTGICTLEGSDSISVFSTSDMFRSGDE
ncbi:hypothetical protein D3C87_1591430 [compost metagenome]